MTMLIQAQNDLSDTTKPAEPTRREQIIELLSSNPGKDFRVRDIADAIGHPYPQITGLLSQMRDVKEISRTGRGIYVWGLEKRVWADTTKPKNKKSSKKSSSKTASPAAKAEPVVEAPAPQPFTMPKGFANLGTLYRDGAGNVVLVREVSATVAAALV